MSVKSFKDNSGVSEIVGTILLLGLTVSFFASITTVFLVFPSVSSTPSVNLIGVIDGHYLLIDHRGGESLSLSTEVSLTFSDGVTETFVVGDEGLDDMALEDNQWGIGECFVFFDGDMSTHDVSTNAVDVRVVEVETNSLVMYSTLMNLRGD